MRSRSIARFGLTTIFAIALALGAARMDGLAQSKKPVPRTADGHPDLQGMWTNATLTPLERPAALADRAVLSEQEARTYAKDFLESNSTDRRDGTAQQDVQRAYPDYFLDRGTDLAIVNGQRRTSLIVDPPDGRIPPRTATAQTRASRAVGGDVSNNYDDPEARPLAERCLLSFGSSSGPPMLPVLYNNHYQIVQTKDALMIVVEMVHDVRVIPLDGRPHLPPSVRKWLGDSVGHWDGDTLVVDTTNFNPEVSFRGASANLHVIERFTRVDADTILYKFTVDDPSTFTKQWSGEIPLRATDEQMYEYACHEANHALGDILSGARFQERSGEGGKR